jgi:hypothetical protein
LGRWLSHGHESSGTQSTPAIAESAQTV